MGTLCCHSSCPCSSAEHQSATRSHLRDKEPRSRLSQSLGRWSDSFLGSHVRSSVPPSDLSNLPPPMRTTCLLSAIAWQQCDRGSTHTKNDKAADSRCWYFAKWLETQKLTVQSAARITQAEGIHLIAAFLDDLRNGYTPSGTDICDSSLRLYINSAADVFKAFMPKPFSLVNPELSGNGKPKIYKALTDCLSMRANWARPRDQKEPLTYPVFVQLSKFSSISSLCHPFLWRKHWCMTLPAWAASLALVSLSTLRFMSPKVNALTSSRATQMLASGVACLWFSFEMISCSFLKSCCALTILLCMLASWKVKSTSFRFAFVLTKPAGISLFASSLSWMTRISMRWKLPFTSFIVLTCSRSHSTNRCVLSCQRNLPALSNSSLRSRWWRFFVMPSLLPTLMKIIIFTWTWTASCLTVIVWLLPSTSILLDVRVRRLPGACQCGGMFKVSLSISMTVFRTSASKSSSPWPVLWKHQINWFSDCFPFSSVFHPRLRHAFPSCFHLSCTFGTIGVVGWLDSARVHGGLCLWWSLIIKGQVEGRPSSLGCLAPHQ